MRGALMTSVCLTVFAITPAFADHVSTGFGAETAGPITTITADTLAKGKFTAGIDTEYVKSKGFSDDELATFASQHVHAHDADYMTVTTASVNYGVVDDVMLSMRVPYVYRDNIRSASHVHGGGGVVNSADYHGDSGGIGDVSVMGKYRFLNDGHGLRGAVLFGVELPTGKTDNRHHGELLETEHQPGSGSTDFMLGLAGSKSVGSWSYDVSTLFTKVREGSQSTDLGDKIHYGVAVTKRFGGAKCECHDKNAAEEVPHKSLDLILELNGEWANQKEVADVEDENSGGHTLFLSPGVRFSPDGKWAGHLSVGIPVAAHMGDGHAETDYRLTAGIARSF